MSIISINPVTPLKCLAQIISRPKLCLIHRVSPDTKLIPGVANFQALMMNVGRGTSHGGVVVLGIRKPENVYPGRGLFFNEELGKRESHQSPLPGDMIEDSKSQEYRYRVNPEVSLNGDSETIEIASLQTVAFDHRDPAEKFDIDIEWQVSHSGVKPQGGSIVVNGSDMKKILLSNVKQKGISPAGVEPIAEE